MSKQFIFSKEDPSGTKRKKNKRLGGGADDYAVSPRTFNLKNDRVNERTKKLDKEKKILEDERRKFEKEKRDFERKRRKQEQELEDAKTRLRQKKLKLVNEAQKEKIKQREMSKQLHRRGASLTNDLKGLRELKKNLSEMVAKEQEKVIREHNVVRARHMRSQTNLNEMKDEGSDKRRRKRSEHFNSELKEVRKLRKDKQRLQEQTKQYEKQALSQKDRMERLKRTLDGERQKNKEMADQFEEFRKKYLIGFEAKQSDLAELEKQLEEERRKLAEERKLLQKQLEELEQQRAESIEKGGMEDFIATIDDEVEKNMDNQLATFHLETEFIKKFSIEVESDMSDRNRVFQAEKMDAKLKIERTRTLVKELSGMLEEDIMSAEEAKEAGDGLDIQIVQDSIATDQQAILEERQAVADLRQDYDIQLQELHEQKRSLRLERDEYEDNLRLLEEMREELENESKKLQEQRKQMWKDNDRMMGRILKHRDLLKERMTKLEDAINELMENEDATKEVGLVDLASFLSTSISHLKNVTTPGVKSAPTSPVE